MTELTKRLEEATSAKDEISDELNSKIQSLEAEMRDIEQIQVALNEQTKSLEEEKQSLREEIDEKAHRYADMERAVEVHQANEVELSEHVRQLEAEKVVIQMKLAEETLALNEQVERLRIELADGGSETGLAQLKGLEDQNAKLVESSKSDEVRKRFFL